MRQELREAVIVGFWIAPVAFAANVLGFLFLLAFEGSRRAGIGYMGYLAIPMAIGFVVFGVALRNRPRAARLRDALVLRPVALYVFLVAIGLWLWIGFHSPGFALAAPIAVAPVAASLAGIGAVVWRARPSRVTIEFHVDTR